MQVLDVFISYKREERALADTLITELNEAGYVVGTDADVEPNMDFVDAIQTMIESARLTLVLWTELSSQSDWVRIEARHAMKLDQDKTKPNSCRGVLLGPVDLPMDFTTKNMIDCSADGLTTANIDKILAEVSTILPPSTKTPNDARQLSSSYAEEVQAFHIADQIDDPDVFRQFGINYPNSVLLPLVERRIKGHERVWPRHLRKVLTVGGLGVIIAAGGLAVSMTNLPIWEDPAPSELMLALSVANEQVQRLDESNTTLRQSITSKDEDFSALFDDARTTNQALAKSQTDKEGLKISVADLGEQVLTLNAQIAQAEKEQSATLAEKAAALRRAASLEANLGDLRTQTDTQIETLTRERNFLDNGLRVTQATRDRALAKVAELEDANATLEALNATSARRILALENEIAMLRESTALLGSQTFDPTRHYIQTYATYRNGPAERSDTAGAAASIDKSAYLVRQAPEMNWFVHLIGPFSSQAAAAEMLDVLRRDRKIPNDSFVMLNKNFTFIETL